MDYNSHFNFSIVWLWLIRICLTFQIFVLPVWTFNQTVTFQNAEKLCNIGWYALSGLLIYKFDHGWVIKTIQTFFYHVISYLYPFSAKNNGIIWNMRLSYYVSKLSTLKRIKHKLFSSIIEFIFCWFPKCTRTIFWERM